MIYTAEIKVYGKNIGCAEGMIQGESEEEVNKYVELVMDTLKADKIVDSKNNKKTGFINSPTPFFLSGRNGVEWLKLYQQWDCSNAYKHTCISYRLIPIQDIFSVSVTYKIKDTNIQSMQKEMEWDKRLVETTKRCVDLIHGKSLSLVEKSEGIYRVLKEELGGEK